MTRLLLLLPLLLGCTDELAADLDYADRLVPAVAFRASVEEREMGRKMLRHILQNYAPGGAEVVGSRPATGASLVKHQRLHGILRQILVKLPEGDLHAVVVLDTTDVVHFALPDGFIVLSLGALMRTRNDHEIAGLIAYELSAVKRRLLVQELAKVPYAERVERGADIVLREGFTRAFAMRLDVDAWQAMQMGGYEPMEYLRLLERWSRETSEDFGPLDVTHPPRAERAEALRQWSAPRPKGPKDVPASPRLLKLWQEILR